MKKKVPLAIILLVSLSVGLVYAQESGYLINITNSNANINTVISNSTVVENVSLSNGTLNLQINSDNISSVIISGINYTAQQSPSPQSPPNIIITYYGMNVGPAGILAFMSNPVLDTSNDQTVSSTICYTWNITVTNLTPTSLPGGNFDQALAPLVTKYPNLLDQYIPNTVGHGVSNNLTPTWCCRSFNGNLAKCCFALFAKSELSSDQISSLTQDLTTQLTPAIIEWYS